VNPSTASHINLITLLGSLFEGAGCDSRLGVSSRLLSTSFATAIEAASMCSDTYPRLSAVLPSEREAIDFKLY
jgi:hypothetical protein